VGDQSPPAESHDPRIDAALRDYLERIDRGEMLDPAHFVAQHAEIAHELRSLINAEVELRKLASGDAEADRSDTSAGAEASTPADTSTRSFALYGQETIAPEARVKPTDGGTASGLKEQFGRYRIVKVLGQGAMGTVYLAEDTQLKRQVALKTPHFDKDPSGELLERLYREARAAATLRHPNICPVHDVGEIDGTHYISMAYIEGHPLSAFIRSSKPQPERQILIVVRKLAQALQEAHEHKIVHRDLKPANIMVDKRGEPLIMDFGLARHTRPDEDVRLTHSGTLVGTPAYMAPEQVDGDSTKIGPLTDEYSLGVILYELLTGQLPFRGSMMAVLGQIVTRQAAPPSQIRPGIDPRIEAACLKMMAKNPSDRFPSLTAVADELATILRNPVAPAAAAGKSAAGFTLPTAAKERTAGEAGSSKILSSKILQSQALKTLTAGDLESLEELARKCLARHDYEQVIQIAERIPEQTRNAALQSLLENARAKADEIAFLICDIDEAVRLEDSRTALKKADALLKIKPGHHRALEVQERFAGEGEGGVARIGRKRLTQAWSEGGWIPWSALAFGAAVVGIVAGVIFWLSGRTLIVVKTDDPNIKVEFKGQKAFLTVPGKQQITVTPGEGEFTLNYEGLETVTRSFTIKQRETKVLDVRIADQKLVAQFEGEILPPPAASEKVKNVGSTPVEPKEPATAGATPVAATNAAQSDDGYVPLFNGKDLSGWSAGNQQGGWHVENGLLVGGGPAGDRFLYSDRADYKNFRLRVEARLKGDESSELWVRTQIPSTNSSSKVPTTGFEVDLHEPADSGKPRTGSIWAVTPKPEGGRSVNGYSRMDPMVQPGRWFTLEVVAQGNQVYVLVNGELAHDTNWVKRDQYESGRIAIQQHLGKPSVEFRKIEIKEMPASIAPVAGAAARDGFISAPVTEAQTGVDLKSVAFAPNGGWAILYNARASSFRNIPHEAFNELTQLGKEGAQLKSFTFAPNGGWAILYNEHGYFARDIPDEAIKRLDQRAKAGNELKSITFTPKGGWAILDNKHSYYARRIPDEAYKKLGELAGQDAELKSITFTPTGGWAILYNKNEYVAKNIPDEVSKGLSELARQGAELKAMTFTPTGGWVILYNKNDYLVGNIPVEALDKLGALAPRAVAARKSTNPPADKDTLIAPFDESAAKAARQKWADRLKQPVTLKNSIAMPLELLPPGQFEMGSDRSARHVAPAHTVRITRPFYLGTYEVTRGQFAKFVAATHFKTHAEYMPGGWRLDNGDKDHLKHEGKKSYTWRKPGFPQDDRHPVVDVCLDDAIQFCNWLSRTEGRNYRLPTEAEWEYACRAGTTTSYYNGDNREELTHIANVADAKARSTFPAWLALESSDGWTYTSPVGSFAPNGFGLYDTLGNVMEWCSDWYDKDYYKTSPQENPAGAPNGKQRTARGGSFTTIADASARWYKIPDHRFPDVGFRVVCEIAKPAEPVAAIAEAPAPPSPDTRRLWVGHHRFENISRGKWRETAPGSPKDTYYFREVARTPQYVELFDNSREKSKGGCHIRIEDSRVLIIWGGRDKDWRELYRGAWVTKEAERGSEAGQTSDSSADRRAAASVLALGGKVAIRQGSNLLQLEPGNDLPATPFRLVGIKLSEKPDVTDATLEPFEGLSELSELDLSKSTALTDAGLAHLEPLTQLKFLSLYETRITDAGIEHLRGLVRLESLWIQQTDVGDAGLAHLRDLAQLRSLLIWGTHVTDAGLVHLEPLQRLEGLMLSGRDIGDAGLAHLKSLKQLKSLWLTETNVTDAGLAQLSGLPQLRDLNLRGSRITDACVAQLQALKSLKSLGLEGTKVTRDGAEQLKKSLPNCQIRISQKK
jgi:serine/threonine protein kinase/formylglycine-generating enzyme required for sulfatase activity